MQYKLIIWDWNGTLIDDTWMCIEVINELLVKYSKPTLTLEAYHKVFDFPVRKYYQRIGFDFEETPFETVGSEFMDRYWQRWCECELHAGAIELIQNLKEENIPQIIISAAETRLIQACVEHFNIAHYFKKLCGLDHHYATGKEGLTKECVKSVDYDPSDILFIGDTVHDFEVARAVGVACILVARGHHPRYKLEKCSVPVFDSLFDVHKHIFDREG